MALPLQKFREIVFQLLYSQSFAPVEWGDSIPFMMEELKVTKRSMLEARGMVERVLEKLPLIDPYIEEGSAIGYSFERISRVEKTILRLGVYELCHDETLPPKVAIAEAIRLCRKFGTPESASFVNALLDFVYKKKRLGGEPVGELSKPLS